MSSRERLVVRNASANRIAVRLLFCLSVSLLTSHDSRLLAAGGKDGFDVLALADSPRQAAMAGTGAALSPDADSFSRNPGALGLVRSPEASLSHAALPLSVSLQSAAYAHPRDKGTWAGRATFLSAGGLKGFDATGNPTGEVKAQDGVFALGYGRRLPGGSSLGAAAKQVRQSVGGVSAGVWALDAGWVRPLLTPALRFSLAARNVGGKASFIAEDTSLPRSYEAGLAYRAFHGALGAAVEARASAQGTAAAAGIEGWMAGALALRAGYDGGRETGGGVTLGIGFRSGGLRVDYAFLPQGEAFDPVHRFGFSLRFRGPGARALEEGVALSQKGRHADAIYKFKEALDEDPSLAEAVRGLRESAAALERQLGESRR